jgi:hypothetical protein
MIVLTPRISLPYILNLIKIRSIARDAPDQKVSEKRLSKIPAIFENRKGNQYLMGV